MDLEDKKFIIDELLSFGNKAMIIEDHIENSSCNEHGVEKEISSDLVRDSVKSIIVKITDNHFDFSARERLILTNVKQLKIKSLQAELIIASLMGINADSNEKITSYYQIQIAKVFEKFNMALNRK